MHNSLCLETTETMVFQVFHISAVTEGDHRLGPIVMNEHLNKERQLPTSIPLRAEQSQSNGSIAKTQRMEPTIIDLQARQSGIDSRLTHCSALLPLISLFILNTFTLINTVTSIYRDTEPQCKYRLLLLV